MKYSSPYISIIVPAYNAEKSLKKSIESIVEQEYKSYEIIIVNDGSKDGTKEVCQELVDLYPTIRIIDSENKGVSSARNLGLEAANGDWIGFLDSDDCMLPRSLEVLADQTRQTDIKWIIGNFISQNEKSGEKILNRQYFNEKVHTGTLNELPVFCASRNFHCVWGKLYAKSVIKTHQIRFDESRKYGEDLLFNLKYISYVDRFVVLNTAVYFYCYQWGTGLGCSTQKDEWSLQKELCKTVKKELAVNQYIDDNTLKEMNHFYFSQCIASLERTVIEKDQTNKNRILSDPYFMKVLQVEKEEQRIHKIDYWLLKRKWIDLYYGLHKRYAKLKKYK